MIKTTLSASKPASQSQGSMVLTPVLKRALITKGNHKFKEDLDGYPVGDISNCGSYQGQCPCGRII
eukprot:7114923-Ditylum_brightwellii.AAC.1